MAVLPVGRHDTVFGAQCVHDAGGHRLLADIEMQKTANLLLRIEFGALLLEPPDKEHIAVEFFRFLETHVHR